MRASSLLDRGWRLGSVGALVLGFLLPLALTPARAEGSPALALISQTIDEAIAILEDPKLDEAMRRTRIEELAYERFDFETMSKLVVARYWKSFSKEEKAQFIAEFKDFLSRTYGKRLQKFQDEKVEILGERPEQRGDVTVQTKIVGGDYDGALVDYRLRDFGGAWRMIDVKIEGISLVMNYRDQFKTFLARGGAEELIHVLRDKNAKGVDADLGDEADRKLEKRKKSKKDSGGSGGAEPAAKTDDSAALPAPRRSA